MSSVFVFAQTPQQIKLLGDRVNIDNEIIAKDQNDIQRDQELYNASVTVKQNEINQLTAEMQAAESFLNSYSAINWPVNGI